MNASQASTVSMRDLLRIGLVASLVCIFTGQLYGAFTLMPEEIAPTHQALDIPLPTAAERHVLLGLSGNSTGFIQEFEVSLKSILMNAPIWNPLSIHIMADEAAFHAVSDVLHERANITQWSTHLPMTITVYNVQQHEAEWISLIQERMSTAAKFTKHSLYRHTVGAYYRLFAHKVLDPSIASVVYVDTDTVVLAAMDHLWEASATSSSTILFYWGEARCSAFMLLKPSKLEEVWSVFQTVPEAKIKKLMSNRPVASDQLVFKSINWTYPELVGVLPPAWDNHANEWMKDLSQLFTERPDGVGMLHYNGGGTSKEAFFHEHNAMKNKFWALSRYYVDMPWSWARFTVESRIPQHQRGYKVTVHTQ